ncbi:MAG: glutathione S-transferase family protein [Myxococcota bacterium]
MSDPMRVYSMPGNDRVATVSPFSLKLETWLRMFGVPHERVDAMFQQSPNGHLPFIEHEGERLTDSARIIAYTKNAFGIDPDAGLSASERALATLVTNALEEGFKFVRVYDTFVDDANFERAKAYVCARLPTELHEVVPAGIRKTMLEKLAHQGMATLTRDEVHAKGASIIAAVAALLGDTPFFFGQRPTTLDATVYGFLATQLRGLVESPVCDAVRAHPNLVDFLQRIDSRYWAKDAA